MLKGQTEAHCLGGDYLTVLVSCYLLCPLFPILRAFPSTYGAILWLSCSSNCSPGNVVSLGVLLFHFFYQI